VSCNKIIARYTNVEIKAFLLVSTAVFFSTIASCTLHQMVFTQKEFNDCLQTLSYCL